MATAYGQRNVGSDVNQILGALEISSRSDMVSSACNIMKQGFLVMFKGVECASTWQIRPKQWISTFFSLHRSASTPCWAKLYWADSFPRVVIDRQRG